jgi:hypothetical protein
LGVYGFIACNDSRSVCSRLSFSRAPSLKARPNATASKDWFQNGAFIVIARQNILATTVKAFRINISFHIVLARKVKTKVAAPVSYKKLRVN